MTERLLGIGVQSVERVLLNAWFCVAILCSFTLFLFHFIIFFCSLIFRLGFRIIIELIYIYYYCQFEQQICPIVPKPKTDATDQREKEWAQSGMGEFTINQTKIGWMAAPREKKPRVAMGANVMEWRVGEI